MVKQVTIGYCCQWLLCILGWLLQATRGDQACMFTPSEWPKIYGTNKVSNLHIQGEENLSYFVTHYHQLEFTSQQVVIFVGLYVYGLVNESKFMCICNHLHEDLSLLSFRFVTIFMWICCHLHVCLSLVSFRFVMIFRWICSNLCVYLSLVSFQFVIIVRMICTPLHGYYAIP